MTRAHASSDDLAGRILNDTYLLESVLGRGAFGTVFAASHIRLGKRLAIKVLRASAGHAALHDMMVTRDFYETLPVQVRKHLVCRVVDELVPIVQKHQIEELVLGLDDTSTSQVGGSY